MNTRRLLTDIPAARWGVMVLASFVMATNYYFYDLLAPIQDLLRIHLGFSASDFGMIMSAYAVPNVFLVMAVLGGIILDRIGIRITGFTFVFLMAVGGAITAYAASPVFLNGGIGYHFMDSFLTSYSPQLKMMITGFFIFGLGAETSIVVLSKVIVKWFKGKELALALGLNLGIGRLGAALAFTLTPRLVHPEWTAGINFGVLLLWIGLLGFIIYMLVDAKVDKQQKINLEDPEEKFRFKDLLDLITNRSVIFITLLCVTFYSAVFPFLKFAPDLLMNKFAMPRQMAGDVTSYLMYGTIVLTPLFGWYTDNKGKSATLMYLGSGLLIAAHLMFALTHIEPRIPIVLLGIAFSLVPAAMWPAVTKIVSDAKLGTAYGFMFSVQNVGLFVFPMLIGFVVDFSNPDFTTELNASEFKQVQKADMKFTGKYLDRKDRPISENDVHVKTVVFDTAKESKIVWEEEHITDTDENGTFELELGQAEALLSADFSRLSDTISYRADLFAGKEDEKTLVYSGAFTTDENGVFKASVDKKNEDLLEAQHKGNIIVYDSRNNETVWEESARFYIDETGNFEVIMGQGFLQDANPKYLGINSGAYTAEIIRPLNYTNPMLVFSVLGILGIVFAFLLKREDKTSGYGLEQPNKAVD